MSRILVGASLLALALAGTAQAASEAEMKTCMASVDTLNAMLADSDNAEGEKAKVKTLIEQTAEKCESGDLEGAKQAAADARGIMATE